MESQNFYPPTQLNKLVSQTADLTKKPKLGNFLDKLDLSGIYFTSTSPVPSTSSYPRSNQSASCSSQQRPPPKTIHPSQQPNSLGNFSKVFKTFGKPLSSDETAAKMDHSEYPRSAMEALTNQLLRTQGVSSGSSTKAVKKPHRAMDSRLPLSAFSLRHPKIKRNHHAMPLSTPPLAISLVKDGRQVTRLSLSPSVPSNSSSFDSESKDSKSDSDSDGSTLASSLGSLTIDSPPKRAIYYKDVSNNGTLKPLFIDVKTEKEKTCKSIAALLPHWLKDIDASTRCPENLYLFLDTSNITISFQKALAVSHGLPKDTWFSPEPKLSMRRLTDNIVRERRVRYMAAGCSRHPAHPEPAYADELRQLGYRVDMSVRVPEVRIYPTRYGMTQKVHYVEHLVDEQIQQRMTEVMKHCDGRVGTMILVTGDGKPAKQSDGFFKHAERALEAGWTVELVSWAVSCSLAWKNTVFLKKWGSRFRHIELDSFLDDVWVIDE